MFIDISIFNNTGFSNIEDLFFFIINFAISISVVLAVIALIVAGFRFMLAMGDDNKIGDATRSLLFALIGLVLVFISPRVIEFVIDNILSLGA